MSDLEMVKACAEAMGYEPQPGFGEKHGYVLHPQGGEFLYWPLTDDAQNAALDGWILRHGWTIDIYLDCFEAVGPDTDELFHFRGDMTKAENRRRARVECVAKLHKTGGQHG